MAKKRTYNGTGNTLENAVQNAEQNAMEELGTDDVGPYEVTKERKNWGMWEVEITLDREE